MTFAVLPDSIRVFANKPQIFGEWLCSHFGGTGLAEDPTNVMSRILEIPGLGAVVIRWANPDPRHGLYCRIKGPLTEEIETEMREVGALVNHREKTYTVFSVRAQDDTLLSYITLTHD